jgi:hypothetical protein
VTTYPFVQAAYDFGKRKGPTLGLMFHGAEAESGVVGYLSRDPARHVSANFVCERDGRMVRMLNIDNASGSMNPADRSTDKAYYGHKHLVAVLGDWWRDPNSVVISVEIEMYARIGPNDAQVNSLIAWSKDMKSRYRSIRGALGHADQTDTKGCPGTTAKMRLVFNAIGGHGLWGVQEDQEEPVKIKPAGIENWALDGGPNRVTTIGIPERADGKPDPDYRVAYVAIPSPGEDYFHEVARDRLSDWKSDLDKPLLAALANYKLTAGDSTHTVAYEGADRCGSGFRLRLSVRERPESLSRQGGPSSP